MSKTSIFHLKGPFGAYDQTQLQRGLKVYTEVCSSCHGSKYVPLRTLADKDGLGYSEDQFAHMLNIMRYLILN